MRKGQTDPDVVHVNTGNRESAKLSITSTEGRDKLSPLAELGAGEAVHVRPGALWPAAHRWWRRTGAWRVKPM